MSGSKQVNYFYRIDLYRFVFTVFVVLLHFECFYPTSTGGRFESLYRSVDFFFVLSGFLLFRSFKAGRYAAALDYTLSKAKRLMPLNLLMVVLACAASSLAPLDGLKSLAAMAWSFIVNFFSSSFNLLFLQVFVPALEKFIPHRFEGLPIWYISVLLVASFIWYWLLQRLERQSARNPKYHAWGLVAAALVFSYFIREHGKLDFALDLSPNFNVPLGFLRGFAEMGVGIFCANYRFKVENRFARSCLKVFVPLFLFALAFYAKYTAIDFIFVAFAAFAVTFEFSLCEETGRGTVAFCKFLNRISLALYFSHAFVIFFEYDALIRNYPQLGENLALDVAVRAALLAATTFVVHWLSKPVAKLLERFYVRIKLT